jgi:transmembrane sensor
MNDINKKYAGYSVVELLEDMDFLRWLLDGDFSRPNVEDVLQSCDAPLKKNITTAIRVLQSIKINQQSLSEKEKDEMLSNICARYQMKKRRRIVFRLSAAAACLAIVVGSFFFNGHRSNEEKDNFVSTISCSPSDMDFNHLHSVEVVTNGGKNISIAEDADISTNGNQLQVKGQNSKTEYNSMTSGKYSTLLVPYGRRSYLTLPDGSKVWVNSGTEVRFPNKNDAKARQIYVDGEIYIEVAHNNKIPFYVMAPDFRVRVYGTKFNVTSYHSDAENSVVLVEGKVAVKSNTSGRASVMLSPNHRYTQTQRGYKVDKVDAYDYISWKNGMWIFTSEKLSSIMLRLSRYYGKRIVCDPSIANKSCTGKLVLFNDAESTVETISEIFSLKYNVSNHQISISK